MQHGQGAGRRAGMVGALILLTGGVALWAAAEGEEVQATAPPPPATAATTQPAADGQLLVLPDGGVARTKSREEKRFTRADRDDDGVITQAEFLAQRKRNYDKLDRNGDGMLSFEEYAASGIEKFRKADGDGDGRLQAVEFATTAPKPAKRRVATAAPPCPPAHAAQQSETEET